MNSTEMDDRSKAEPKRNGNLPSGMKDFLKQFRKGGISVLARLDKDEQAKVINWAQDIVDQYGSIIKENPMNIKNLADLPFPKEDLKIAIKVLLPAYIAKESDDIVNLLMDRYVSLSTFQSISHEDKKIVIDEANKIDPESGSTGTGLFPTYHKYLEIILSEQKVLLDEVNTFIEDFRKRPR